jgi:phage terminase large subunit GpA-like protein
VSIPAAVTVYDPAFYSGLLPDPLLTVSEWADEHRFLSQRASAEPGRWRTSRTPYLKQIMDDLSATSIVEKIVFVAGAQVGKTEAGNNWIGYVMDVAPGPMLAVQPTVDIAKRFSKQRLQPLIDESPRLREKVRPARERDSGNTLTSKEFVGGLLLLAGANSSAGLRSMPIRNLFLDEVDAYPGDVDGEGDPVSLAEARTRTFARRKMLLTSTPTLAGTSRIWREWESSNQQRFQVPCPECGGLQPITWPQIRWDSDDLDQPPVLICSHCGVGIEERHKTKMLSNGAWIPENPESKIHGYHLSSLYSPLGWFSWTDARAMWLRAQGNQEAMRVFVNTVLGECWAERGDAPDWEDLYNRREDYAIGTPPVKIAFLTCGVDVQQDRIELEVKGWGPNLENWSIDYQIIPGDTAGDEVWELLTQAIRNEYVAEDGLILPIRMTAVDSGYRTQEVYRWAKSQSSLRVMVVKGRDNQATILSTPSTAEVTIRGKKLRGGIKVWPVGVSLAKSELYGWLRRKQPTDLSEGYPHGWCHFPQYAEEYFRQLTAEQMVTRIVRGYQRYQWEKTRDRNEALDTSIYNRAACVVVGADRWDDDRWAMERSKAGRFGADATQTVSKSDEGGIKRRKSSFL